MPKTLLLVRPEPQSTAFAKALAAELPGRFEVLIAPLLRIEPLPGEIELAGVGALLFTSANGVGEFVRRSTDRTRLAYCVGAMTTAAARAAGFDARSADGDVEALADLVIARHPPEAGACLHIRGIHAAGDLAGRLETAGIEVRAAELYDQVACEIEGRAADLLRVGELDVFTVFSPRTATIFAEQAKENGWLFARSISVSLSAAADAKLDALSFADRRVAEHPGREGMMAALAAL